GARGAGNAAGDAVAPVGPSVRAEGHVSRAAEAARPALVGAEGVPHGTRGQGAGLGETRLHDPVERVAEEVVVAVDPQVDAVEVGERPLRSVGNVALARIAATVVLRGAVGVPGGTCNARVTRLADPVEGIAEDCVRAVGPARER